MEIKERIKRIGNNKPAMFTISFIWSCMLSFSDHKSDYFIFYMCLIIFVLINLLLLTPFIFAEKKEVRFGNILASAKGMILGSIIYLFIRYFILI